MTAAARQSIRTLVATDLTEDNCFGIAAAVIELLKLTDLEPLRIGLPAKSRPETGGVCMGCQKKKKLETADGMFCSAKCLRQYTGRKYYRLGECNICEERDRSQLDLAALGGAPIFEKADDDT